MWKDWLGWLDGIIGLLTIGYFYFRRLTKQEQEQELLKKKVEELEIVVKNLSGINSKVAQVEDRVHSLANYVQQLDSKISIASKEETERDTKMNNKMNLLLFACQHIFQKDGMDLSKYKDLMSNEE